MATYDVIAYGAAGTPLNTGDVITGADVNDVYILNGIVKYFPCPEDGPHGQLYRWDGSAYTVCLGSQGDGTYFTNAQASAPDRVTVVSASVDEVELSVEYDAWAFTAPGIVYRDWVGSGGRNFPESSGTPKYIEEARVVKTVIMRRGHEGVFLGYHTDPRVGPLNSQIPTQNNNTDWGEREFQCTGGAVARVTFSSAGVSALHPDFGSDDDWGTSAGGANYAFARHCWLGIDDPNYPPYDQAAYIARQHAGFPAEQTTGPWWAAALHSSNATTHPFCTYLVLRQRLEIGAFQFSSGASGQLTLHFANEAHDAANVPFRTMCFLGAFPYTSAALASEPTASLRAQVANRAHATDFELSGQAEVTLATTTIGAVRDRMITALEAATPTTHSHRKFRAHRENLELTDFAEKSAGAAFRLFTIRDSFPGTTTISTSDLREIHTVIEVVVAYPRTANYRDSSTSKPILELADVQRADLKLLRDTIGLAGYAALERDGVNACVTGEEASVVDGVACSYLVLRLPTMYRESPS